MAQKTMIADMKEVIESMYEAKQLSSTSVDRQFRQVGTIYSIFHSNCVL